MIRHESAIETTGSQPSSTSPHATPPPLSDLGGAVSGTSTA